MVYCPLREIVVTASDMTIRVWGLDWELQMVFVGHTGQKKSVNIPVNKEKMSDICNCIVEIALANREHSLNMFRMFWQSYEQTFLR